MQTWVKKVTVEPSTLREKVWVERVTSESVGADDEDFRFIAVEFEEVLLHPCLSVRQVVRVEWVAEVMVLEERWSWVSSAKQWKHRP